MKPTRSLIGALSVAMFTVAVLARSVFAGPPPPMEVREVKPVIEALKKAPGRRHDLAALRFYAEVFDGTTVSAPVGSPLETVGAWGDNDALMSSEGAMAGCAALPAEKQKLASALLKEFGADLPVLLRAYTLAGEGKKSEAKALFVSTYESIAPAKGCPGEHPMYSHRRVGRMTSILACIKAVDPKGDVKKFETLLERANFCAANNHAVG